MSPIRVGRRGSGSKLTLMPTQAPVAAAADEPQEEQAEFVSKRPMSAGLRCLARARATMEAAERDMADSAEQLIACQSQVEACQSEYRASVNRLEARNALLAVCQAEVLPGMRDKAKEADREVLRSFRRAANARREVATPMRVPRPEVAEPLGAGRPPLEQSPPPRSLMEQLPPN